MPFPPSFFRRTTEIRAESSALESADTPKLNKKRRSRCKRLLLSVAGRSANGVKLRWLLGLVRTDRTKIRCGERLIERLLIHQAALKDDLSHSAAASVRFKRYLGALHIADDGRKRRHDADRVLDAIA